MFLTVVPEEAADLAPHGNVIEGGGLWELRTGVHSNANITTLVHMSCLVHNCYCQPFLSTQSGGESPVHIAAKCGTIRALELIWEWCDVFGKEGEKGGKFGPFTEPDEVSFSMLYE